MADDSSLRELQRAVEYGEELLTVHYACEDLSKATDHPASVGCIGVASWEDGSSRAFSLSDAPRAVEGEAREVDLLNRFYGYLRERPAAKIVHWNMNNSSYGFDAIAERYRYLTGAYPEYNVSRGKTYDLDSLIESFFGENYARHPKLPTMTSLNDIASRFALGGKEEAGRLFSGDIGSVKSSVTEKARAIQSLLELFLAGRLRTQKTSGSVSFADSNLDAVKTVLALGDRFRVVERAIARRHDSRDTLLVGDEYDAQDLLRSLLRIFFDDVRDEVWAPEYAGGSSRVDFLLKQYEIAVELKFTREKLRDRQVGEQLIVDRDKYKTLGGVRHLISLVFDYEGYIENPRGLEEDLARDVSMNDFSVTVRIYDR